MQSVVDHLPRHFLSLGLGPADQEQVVNPIACEAILDLGVVGKNRRVGNPGTGTNLGQLTARPTSVPFVSHKGKAIFHQDLPHRRWINRTLSGAPGEFRCVRCLEGRRNLAVTETLQCRVKACTLTGHALHAASVFRHAMPNCEGPSATMRGHWATRPLPGPPKGPTSLPCARRRACGAVSLHLQMEYTRTCRMRTKPKLTISNAPEIWLQSSPQQVSDAAWLAQRPCNATKQTFASTHQRCISACGLPTLDGTTSRDSTA